MNKIILYVVTVLTVFVTAASGQDIIWSNNYGSASSELGLCGDITSDGGYIIGGVSYQFSGLNGEFWLVRTDANGDTLWTRNYGGNRWQEAHYVIQTDDGGFAVCGGTSVAVGDDDMFIVKTDSIGDTLWTRRFGTPGEDDNGWAIIQTSDGGYLATGHVYDGGSFQLYMVRLNANGDSLWTKFYGGPYSDYGYGIVETADSGFAVTGTYSVTSSSSDVWLLRTDLNGDTLWTNTFDFHNDKDRGDQIVLTPDGGFAIGGRTWNGTYPQLLVLRTDSLGNTIWSREFGTSADEFAESIDITPDGGFVIGGGAGPYPFDFYIVRVGANGDSLWAARYDFDGLPGDSEDCYEIKVDNNGDIIAFGYADVSPSAYDSDYWMIKINDGAIVFPGFLAGLVTDDDLFPVENVIVSVYDSNDSLMGTDSTDSNGEFFFELYPDTYYAEFSKEYYTDTTLTDINIIASETTAVNMIIYLNRYEYMVGDVNMYGGVYPPRVIGNDVTYLVNYFRSMPSSQPCYLNGFWASADVSGDCMIIGNDITTLVNYFRGYVTLLYCDEYPPVDSLPATAPQGWPNCGASDPDRVIELINKSMSKNQSGKTISE